MTSQSPPTVHGHCAPGFEPLRDLLAANLADGTDLGASVAVVRDGEWVVDLWGGSTPDGGPLTEDTLVDVWSVTKMMTALAVLTLIDDGTLDPDAPVQQYWPDFSDGRVLLRHVLSQSSGLCGWRERVTLADLYDLDKSEALLAAQQPWWAPGTVVAYQMLSFGHLLDGIVHGATGHRLATLLRQRLLDPLAADFHLGVPTADLDRCSRMVAPPPSGIDYSHLPPDGAVLKTLANPLFAPDTTTATREWRQAVLPAANGHGNARSVARVQSVLSHGGEVDGRRYLRLETVERVLDVQIEGPDQILGVPGTWGLGFALPNASTPAVPSGRVCWWTGYGGAVCVNDLDRRTTVAYVPNKMELHLVSSPRTDAYLRTAFACLDATR